MISRLAKNSAAMDDFEASKDAAEVRRKASTSRARSASMVEISFWACLSTSRRRMRMRSSTSSWVCWSMVSSHALWMRVILVYSRNLDRISLI